VSKVVLIITHGDQDGAMCAGLLGQVFPDASIFVLAVPARSLNLDNEEDWQVNEDKFKQYREYYKDKIISKITRTREKNLIIIADIGIVSYFKEAIFEKLKKEKSIKFIIFDHHIDPKINHPRVRVFYENVNNAYEIIRRWRKSPENYIPRSQNR